MIKFQIVRKVSMREKKPTYVYDTTCAMLLRVKHGASVEKRTADSFLCCASPIIITNQVDITPQINNKKPVSTNV
jgi:hypothetical protein